MYPNFTPAAIRAMQAACRLATHGQCNAEHLLAGLLEDDEARPAVLLSRAGLDLASIPRCSSESKAASSESATIPPDAFLERVADHAEDYALAASHDHAIGSEHLLLALLQIEPTLRESLEANGLQFNQLHAAIVGVSDQAFPLDEPLQLLDVTEEIDLARIIDASANRAREALRVIEDYCRFVLDDPLLCRQCKQLRHDLADVISGISTELLLEARETIRDVGTSITVESERHRSSLEAVILANCKRLQESLRSLEEYGKLPDFHAGERLERLRYQTYTLERAIVLGGSARQRLVDAHLYVLLSSEACQAALDWTIREAAFGGAQIVQLREKKLNDRDLIDKARRVRRWTTESGVLFILNDRPDIARLVDADGVHLGQDDLSVKEARRIMGPNALIGVSTHNLDQVRQAVLDGAGYIGIGPTFPSATKPFAEFPGLEFVRAVATETSLPAFAIGGINLENIGKVTDAGAHRVAVGEAISQADDPREIAKQLRNALDQR